MGATNWEEYLWKLDKIIAVPPLNEGRIRLLDIFVQDGVAIHSRVMRRIGSMITLGDMSVDGWQGERDDLSKKLLALDDPKDDNVDEPFTKKFDAAGVLNTEVSADSKFVASIFGLVKGEFQKSGTHKIQIRSPFHQRVTEDDLIKYIDGGNYSPLWKPNIKMVAQKERKSRSFFGTDKYVELWIVTELKFASTISDTSTKESTLGANARIPVFVAAGAGLPVEGGVNASTSGAKSTQIEGNGRNILYGFKAVRVRFDEQGDFVSQQGMGKTQVHVTRAGEEVDFNPDNDPPYHMGPFFIGECSRDEGHSDNFKCAPLVLDDGTEGENSH